MPKFSTSDGVQIHYHMDDFRDQWLPDPPETVLMHHGFGRNLKWWAQWVPALSRKYRVVRYDVRGCGESSVPPPEADWSGQRLIKDALDLLNHLKIDKVHWVGMESGGVLGELFAITYPDRIQSLTLVNGPALISAQQLEAYALGEKDSLAAMEKYGLKEWLRRTNPRRVDMKKAEEMDPRIMEWHLNEQSKTAFHAAYALHRTFRGADLRGMLSQIRVPTLMITGETSNASSVEHQRFMQQQIPGAKLVVVAGIQDGIVLLAAERGVRETLNFLGALR